MSFRRDSYIVREAGQRPPPGLCIPRKHRPPTFCERTPEERHDFKWLGPGVSMHLPDGTDPYRCHGCWREFYGTYCPCCYSFGNFEAIGLGVTEADSGATTPAATTMDLPAAVAAISLRAEEGRFGDAPSALASILGGGQSKHGKTRGPTLCLKTAITSLTFTSSYWTANWQDYEWVKKMARQGKVPWCGKRDICPPYEGRLVFHPNGVLDLISTRWPNGDDILEHQRSLAASTGNQKLIEEAPFWAAAVEIAKRFVLRAGNNPFEGGTKIEWNKTEVAEALRAMKAECLGCDPNMEEMTHEKLLARTTGIISQIPESLRYPAQADTEYQEAAATLRATAIEQERASKRARMTAGGASSSSGAQGESAGAPPEEGAIRAGGVTLRPAAAASGSDDPARGRPAGSGDAEARVRTRTPRGAPELPQGRGRGAPRPTARGRGAPGRGRGQPRPPFDPNPNI